MMFKRYLPVFIIIAVFSAFNLTQAQVNPLKIKRKEFKKQELGFKDAWKSVKKAHNYFMLGPGSYREARTEYLNANEYNPDNAELNYMIGRCYLFTDNKFESIKYIKKAYDLKPDVNFDIHLMLGMAYHQALDFDKAIEEYNYFINNVHPKFRDDYQRKVDLLIQQCKNGRLLAAEPKRVVINNLGKGVNSVYDEYGPVISQDGTELYFTSRRKFSKEERSILDDKYFEDAYTSKLVKDSWSRARRLETKLTGKSNTTNVAVLGLSPDKTKIYLYKGGDNGGDIYMSDTKKGAWKSPKPIKKFNTGSREMSFCMSSDGSTIYFVTNNDKKRMGGYGGSDIYISRKNSKGKWGKPENAGNVINTFFDELGVSLSENDSVLYFSSKGHNSMGGYDVFQSTLSDVGLWSKPANLGYPINTPNDDIFYTPIPGKKTALYSSNREAGLGGMDIFKIIYLGVEKDMRSGDLYDNVAALKPQSIYFAPPVKPDIDNSILMRGFISDSENQKPVLAKIEIIDRERSQIIATAISDATGNYSVKLPEPKVYGVEIIAKGYLLYLDIVDLSQKTYDEVVVKNFLLDRVEVGAKVILKNIYFETGKSTLKPESYTSLDNIVKLLKSNEGLRIEISGHTDNVGSAKTNIKLSTDRARAVVNYLVKKGIPETSLEYKGYGFSEPIAPNNTSEGRAKNRRVEFKILSK